MEATVRTRTRKRKPMETPRQRGIERNGNQTLTGNGTNDSMPVGTVALYQQVRMQLQTGPTLATEELVDTTYRRHRVSRHPSMLRTGLKVATNEGIGALYKGLTASMARQVLYTGTRFGAYDIAKGFLNNTKDDGNMAFHKKVVAGLGSGAIGAMVGNPADLALVRMQADGRLPLVQRRNYVNVSHAVATIAKEEGVLSLWRGCLPTVNRAMIVTASQLAVYDQAKLEIRQATGWGNGLPLQASASFAAGIVAALTSTPLDVAKTRLMDMKPLSDGTMPYRGTLDCITRTLYNEGFLAIYRGLGPILARQLPLNIVQFVSVEWCINLYKTFGIA